VNRQPSTPSPQASVQAYVRPSRIEVEPVVFAVALVALVMSISLWRPAAQPQPQQAAPVEHSQTLAAAPTN
jgi:hypothetical protein